ncbi:MAG: zinc dependent phospholipase C family protein [Oscillospiraceae bacterium]
MPDFLTHALFAQKLLDNGNFSLKPYCERHANLFRLGSQGPDLLFYLAHVSHGHKFSELGERLHSMKTTDVLQFLHSLDFKNTDYSFACAYLGGYAAHLCLDETIHPFIERKAAELAEKYGYSVGCGHVKYENRIESRHFVETTGHQPCEYILRCDLPATARETAVVADLNCMIIKQILNVDIDQKLIANAIGRLPKLFNVIFDRKQHYQKALDCLCGISKRDLPVRWRFKRDYVEDEQLLPASEYSEFTSLYNSAADKYLYIVC